MSPYSFELKRSNALRLCDYGATLSLGLPINEQIGTQVRYSISRQDVTLDPSSLAATPSVPIQQAALAGPQWVSAVGDTISYNTLDNNRNPTSGINSQLKQDLAGLGGDVNFLRTTEDVRYYQSLNNDLVGMVRAQGGNIVGYGGSRCRCSTVFSAARRWCGDLRPTDSGRAI